MSTPNLNELMDIDFIDEDNMEKNINLNSIFENITLVTFLSLLPPRAVIPFIREMKMIAYNKIVVPFCKTCKKFMRCDSHQTYKIGKVLY
jgi:hypothetical protein